jgi:uncharacterized protein YkwD
MQSRILLPIAALVLFGGCSGTIGGIGDVGQEGAGSGGVGSSGGKSGNTSGTGGTEPGAGGAGSGGMGAGGAAPGSGGSDPGSGGTDPASGGEDPGSGGEDPGSGGSTPGSGGSTDSGGSSGSGGVVTPGEHYETLTMPGATGMEPTDEMPVCCVPSGEEKQNINEVFELLNEHRAANGLSALRYDDQLEAAVLGHCHHMIAHDFFAHEAPEAAIRTPWTRAELCGSQANGENIAQGQRDPAAVMQAWTNSQGHNQNMLNDNFTRVGIAFHEGCWGQLFGTD